MDEMDEYNETSSLLMSWNTPPDVIERFQENGISIEKFKDLNEAYLKELCPHIGHRINLKSNIQDLLDSFTETETITSSAGVSTNIEEVNPASASEKDSLNDVTINTIIEDKALPNLSFDIDTLLNPERAPLPEFDIKTLLQTSAHGNSILSYYKQYKTLNAKKRNALVDIVIKHIYTFVVHNKLKPEDYNLLAAKIVAVFPSESPCTYYMKAIPTSKSCTGKYIPAKGKLVDKVRNLIYISEARRRPSNLYTDDEEKENLECTENNENLPGTSDDALWLNTNIEPWDEVIDKWNKTFAERQNSKLSTVHEYLEKWQILKSKKGHLLINLDFEKLYKQLSLNFFKHWESFFVKLLKLKQHELTNENALQILETLRTITENDKKIPLQITLLGYLVPPKGRLSKKIKFSSTEAIEGLIVQTYNAGDIDSIIRKQKEKAASRNLTVQPYVLLVGRLQDFSAIYIVIDDIKYELQSAAQAFDLLFKIYHVFHVKYPQASSHLYIIVQRKIYDIKTAYDVIPPHIVEILNL